MERSVMFWYIYALSNNRGNYPHHLEHWLHCGGTFKILSCNCFQADNALLLAVVTLCAVESDVGGMFNLYLHTRKGWRKVEPWLNKEICTQPTLQQHRKEFIKHRWQMDYCKFEINSHLSYL